MISQRSQGLLSPSPTKIANHAKGMIASPVSIHWTTASRITNTVRDCDQHPVSRLGAGPDLLALPALFLAPPRLIPGLFPLPEQGPLQFAGVGRPLRLRRLDALEPPPAAAGPRSRRTAWPGPSDSPPPAPPASFSHLDTDCRETYSVRATSCWDRPLAARSFCRFSPNVIPSSPHLHGIGQGVLL